MKYIDLSKRHSQLNSMLILLTMFLFIACNSENLNTLEKSKIVKETDNKTYVPNEKTVFEFLFGFYTNYELVWEKGDLENDPDGFYKSIDSLTSSYCTKKVQKLTNEWAKDGHDYITQDGILYIDFNSFKVQTLDKEFFKISYNVNEKSIYEKNKTNTYKITLKVKVILESGKYYIDDVVIMK